MRPHLSFACLFCFLTSVAGEAVVPMPRSANSEFTVSVQVSIAIHTDSLSYKIIEGIDHTYGYEISLNGRILVHQPSIPCLKGTKGFVRKEEARKVAELVIAKIRKGIMPPTVTVQELKTVGVVF